MAAMPPADRSAFRAVVKGRVQGVGFRYSAAREARRLRVTGEVANMPDGSVEVVAEGDPVSLEAFLEWLHRGPPGAHVNAVDVQRGPATGRFTRFDVTF
jgi:acylphosphatase